MGRPSTVKVGTRYGRLTVTDIIGNGKGRGVSAVCDCDCGTRGHLVRRESLSKMRSCGCSQHDTGFRKGRAADSYPRKEEGVGQLNNLFYQYRRSAEKRGLSFELSLEAFANIVAEDCWYCGEEAPLRVTRRSDGRAMYNGGTKANGIDRVANSEGYTLSNSVACCTRCNMMKHAQSAEDFVAHARKIVNHQGGNGL